MQEITVLHGCLISIPKVSQKKPDCFCEITACEIYLMGVHIAILRAHVYSLRTCFFHFVLGFCWEH